MHESKEKNGKDRDGKEEQRDPEYPGTESMEKRSYRHARVPSVSQIHSEVKRCVYNDDILFERQSMKWRTVKAGLLMFLLASAAASQGSHDPRVGKRPDAEFQIARVIYRTNARAGSHGIVQPMWAVDYPLAEQHFLTALKRYTRIDVADDSRHLDLNDERLFQYPFLFLQQPGYWFPDDTEVEHLREYLLRGGFLFLDDFHGRDWSTFEDAITRVFPDRPLEDVPKEDAIMQIFFNIDERTQVPGDRHLYRGMEGPAAWKGIYDDHHRLMVIANYNQDTGDAWEHADDPNYPLPMTAFAYQMGTNYVLYALTH